MNFNLNITYRIGTVSFDADFVKGNNAKEGKSKKQKWSWL